MNELLQASLLIKKNCFEYSKPFEYIPGHVIVPNCMLNGGCVFSFLRGPSGWRKCRLADNIIGRYLEEKDMPKNWEIERLIEKDKNETSTA